MWTRNQRQIAVRLFLKRLGLLCLLMIAIFSSFNVWNVYKKERETSARRAEAETERSELAVREKTLRTNIETLASDRGLEETLRAQYGLAEAGEGLIMIVDRPISEPLHATSSVRHWFWGMFWPW